MKKSLLMSAALMGVLFIAPTSQAQVGWPGFKGKSTVTQGLSVDPVRGVVTIAPIVEKATPAVVNIAVSSKVKRQDNPFAGDDFFERFFGDRGVVPNGRQNKNGNQDNQDNDNTRIQRSAGSGVIIDAAKGYVLTNHHVVDGADKITVTLTDRRTATAEIVGSDAGTDLALIKIDLDNLTQLNLVDSDGVKVGDYVIAIGNAFGIGQSVTTGIVSALGRSTFSGDKYQNYIQTDAAINQGNSGGALINSRGELIGINSAILSRSGGSNGIGFAVPSNMVTGIMDQLIAYGEVRRGRIGVTIQNITPDLMEAMNLQSPDGALVSSVVEDSPAEHAGLKSGDVITGFNGHEILDSDDIRNAVGFVERGHRANITYVRDGKKRSTKILVEKAPDDAVGSSNDNSVEDAPTSSSFKAFDGASFSNIPTDLDAKGGTDGVIITSIKRGSDAWDAGLRKDDIIRAVNTKDIKNLEDFKKALANKKGAVALTVQRGRAIVFIAVK